MKTYLVAAFLTTILGSNLAQAKDFSCRLSDVNSRSLPAALKISSIGLSTTLKPEFSTVTPFVRVAMGEGSYRFNQDEFRDSIFKYTTGNYFSSGRVGLSFLNIGLNVLAGQRGTVSLNYYSGYDLVYSVDYDCYPKPNRH